MPWVTITFETKDEMAMMYDWTRALGLLDPELWRRLAIEPNTLEVHVGDKLVGDEPDSSRDVS